MTSGMTPRTRHPSGQPDLDAPVTLREVTEFDRRHRTPSGQRWWVISLIVGVYIVGTVVVIAVLLPAAGLPDEVGRRVFSGFAVVTALYTGAMGLIIWRNAARRVRIDRRATAHGLTYSATEPLGRFAGTALTRPGALFATDVVFGDVDPAPGIAPGFAADPAPGTAPGFAAGTFAPGTGFTVRRAGFIQLALESPTPHIALVNHRSAVLRHTGSRILAAQRLRLEGDFDRTFTLYCPTGYERDALYIFTPDLMALLLDVASDCEIELVDGWLVAYVGRPWRLWRGRDFAAMIALVDAVSAKARRRTRRYQDDRALRGVVAPEGRRLRARPTAGSVLSIIVPVALGVYGVISWVTT